MVVGSFNGLHPWQYTDERDAEECAYLVDVCLVTLFPPFIRSPILFIGKKFAPVSCEGQDFIDGCHIKVADHNDMVTISMETTVILLHCFSIITMTSKYFFRLLMTMRLSVR